MQNSEVKKQNSQVTKQPKVIGSVLIPESTNKPTENNTTLNLNFENKESKNEEKIEEKSIQVKKGFLQKNGTHIGGEWWEYFSNSFQTFYFNKKTNEIVSQKPQIPKEIEYIPPSEDEFQITIRCIERGFKIPIFVHPHDTIMTIKMIIQGITGIYVLDQILYRHDDEELSNDKDIIIYTNISKNDILIVKDKTYKPNEFNLHILDVSENREILMKVTTATKIIQIKEELKLHEKVDVKFQKLFKVYQKNVDSQQIEELKDTTTLEECGIVNGEEIVEFICCKLHEKSSEKYCFSCEEVLCLECEKIHENHNTTDISKANEEIVQNLKKMVESMEYRSKEIATLTKDIKEKKKYNEESYNDMIKELNDYFESIYRSVEQAKTKVFENFKQIHQQNDKFIDESNKN
eukprot:gene11026-3732_t